MWPHWRHFEWQYVTFLLCVQVPIVSPTPPPMYQTSHTPDPRPSTETMDPIQVNMLLCERVPLSEKVSPLCIFNQILPDFRELVNGVFLLILFLFKKGQNMFVILKARFHITIASSYLLFQPRKCKERVLIVKPLKQYMMLRNVSVCWTCVFHLRQTSVSSSSEQPPPSTAQPPVSQTQVFQPASKAPHSSGINVNAAPFQSMQTVRNLWRHLLKNFPRYQIVFVLNSTKCEYLAHQAVKKRYLQESVHHCQWN